MGNSHWVTANKLLNSSINDLETRLGYIMQTILHWNYLIVIHFELSLDHLIAILFAQVSYIYFHNNIQGKIKKVFKSPPGRFTDV